MKKLILVILSIWCVTATAQITEVPPVWSERPTAYVLKGSISGIDSNDVTQTTGFDATYIVQYMMRGGGDWTSRDTTVTFFWHNNDVGIILTIDGTGSVDSLSYVYYQTQDQSGNWYTIDTLATNKATPCLTLLSQYGYAYTSSGRLKVAGKDITSSGYAMKFTYEIIIPKQ